MAAYLVNKFSIAATVFISTIPAQVLAHSYGPAPRVTAGPGDNPLACTQCHTTSALNSGPGSVKILLQSGPVYIPGVRQRITVEVSDPSQQRWGFELTARLNSDLQNGQAGDLIPVDNFTQVICEDAGPKPCASGVSFIQHTSAGTRNGTKGGATFQFDWAPPSANAGPVTFFVAGNAANGNGAPTGDLIYTSSVQLDPVIPIAPSVTSGNVVSAATSADGPVAGNSWVTIYGSNLGVTTRSWTNADFVNGGMPFSLDGVSVLVSGAPRLAYVGYVSPTQVNFLLPSDITPATVQVQVRNSAGISQKVPLTVQANAVQLLTWDGKYVSGSHANGDNVGKAGLLGSVPATPAVPGETVSLNATGYGPTSPASIPGLVPAQTLSIVTPPTVTIGGVNAPVVSAIVAPGATGVCQINIQVPANVPNGDQPVVVQGGGFNSAPVLITIQR
jgi:uncharacterized protein (TIGR03437 family)